MSDVERANSQSEETRDQMLELEKENLSLQQSLTLYMEMEAK